jgi:hypothetical protein
LSSPPQHPCQSLLYNSLKHRKNQMIFNFFFNFFSG